MNEPANRSFPESWAICRLGDIIRLEYGKSLPKKARSGTGAVSVFGSSGEVGIHDKALVEEPCIIVGRKGSAGSTFISRGPCWPIDTVYFVRASPNYNLRFLYYLLSSLRLVELDRSTAIPGLNRDDAYAVDVGFPPLNEQNRIVEKIETLFAHINKGEEALREVQKLLKRYRQSILKAAVTGELTRDWREANQHKLEPSSDFIARILDNRARNWQGTRDPGNPSSTSVTEMPDVPAEWEWAPLDSLCVEGPTNGISPKGGNAGAGIKSFKLTATTSGEFLINEETIKRVDLQLDQDSKYWLRSGDILIQRGNTIDYVGTAAIFPGPDGEFIYPDLMMRVRIQDPSLARWAVIWINAYYAKQYFKRNATGTAGNMPKINGKTLKALAVPIPPIEEIHQLLKVLEHQLEQAKKLGRTLERELARATSLRQSILKSGFTGQLVSQDPDDEPASKLLARIRAERETSTKAKSRGRASG